MNQFYNSHDNKNYRAAGRAVMSYFAGYSCKQINNTEENSICNLYDFDFGDDANLINAISSYKDNPDIYDSLPENSKNRCKNVSLKTIIVIMGGPAGEFLKKNNGNFADTSFLTIPAHDLKIADRIDYFLSIIKHGQHPNNYLQGIFRQVLEIMQKKETWNAVSTLALAIEKSFDNRLERKEIEKILVETGFLSYLCSLRQGKKIIENPADTCSLHITQTPPHNEGFSREELEEMKRKSHCSEILNKQDAVTKIVSFAKNCKFGQLQIGLADYNQKELLSSGKIIVETQSNEVAKEVLMYFVCLGMTISPTSSKSSTASTVFVNF